MAQLYGGYKQTFQTSKKQTVTVGTVAKSGTTASPKTDVWSAAIGNIQKQPLATTLINTLSFGAIGGAITGALTLPKGSTPSKPSFTPGVPKTVVKTLTPSQQSAIDWANQQKLGTSLLSTPHSQKVVSTLKAAQISATLQIQGKSIVPTSDIQGLYTESERAKLLDSALFTLQNQQLQTWADYTALKGKEQQYIDELSKGTNRAAILQGQLTDTQKQYEDILARYNELLNNPPGGGGGLPELPKGTDWGRIAIIGIAAIAGVILLGSFFKRGR